MMALSDGVATDRLMARIGLDALNQRFQTLGLSCTRIATDIQGLVDNLARDLGFESGAELHAAAAGDLGEVARRRTLNLAAISCASVLDPKRTGHTTARNMTALLASSWRDEAAAAGACARVRALMSKQVVQQRLASGFGEDTSWQGRGIFAKSGSLFGLVNNEVGVIQYPEGRCYAAAIFTRAHRIHEGSERTSLVIGAVARTVIGMLRR
jgi:beta-lactamase class A